MADLNEWRLIYPGKDFTFGTAASGFPFATQVDIGEPESSNQDSSHPNSDGDVMGIDRLGGMILTFDCKIIKVDEATDELRWNSNLDALGVFKSAWRADSIRSTPGRYASLTNVDRGRLVFGRPRACGPKLGRLRKGESGVVATFKTISPDFYSADENLTLITGEPPPSGGWKYPLRWPLSTAGTVDEIEPRVNSGDLPTWPEVTFRGPGSAFSLECLQGTNSLWRLIVDDFIQFDEDLVVNTAPWHRGVTINGRPANGRIRGTSLDRCKIPVGNFNFRFRVKDRSGNSFVSVRWRDAFASL